MDPQQTRVRVARFSLVLFAGMCLGSIANSSLSWANNGINANRLVSQIKQLSPEEFAEILRKAQPKSTAAQSSNPCADEMAAVVYWEAVVDAAELTLLDAYAALEDCLGGPSPDPGPVPDP